MRDLEMLDEIVLPLKISCLLRFGDTFVGVHACALELEGRGDYISANDTNIGERLVFGVWCS